MNTNIDLTRGQFVKDWAKLNRTVQACVVSFCLAV